MADLLDPGQLQQIFGALVNNLGALKTLAASTGVPVEALVNTVKKLYDTTKTSAGGLASLTKALNDGASGALNFKNVLSGVEDDLKKFANNREEQIKVLGLASSVLMATTNFFQLKESLGAFDQSMGSADRSAKTFAESLDNFVGKAASGVIANLVDAAGKANSFENAMLNAGMQGGNFYALVGKDASKFSDNLTAATINISNKAVLSANALGISYSEALQRVQKAAADLPGTFGETFELTDSIGPMAQKHTYDIMTALSQVARGTGQAFTDTVPLAKSLIEDFGKKGKGSAEDIALLAKTAKDTGIGIKDVNALALSVNDSFKMWGDQIDGTTSVLGKMSAALKDNGVGIKGQIELTKQLETGLLNTSLPMKGFIALSAGMQGAGGGVGAGLKVEKMLQDRNIGGLVDMMQTALTKKTGTSQVMTLAQATEQPGREGEFIRQRMLLQQMSGIQDTGALNRVMEAMSKGSLGGGTDKTAGATALQEAMGMGKQLADSQTNYAALQIENGKEQVGHLAAIDTRFKSIDLSKFLTKGATNESLMYESDNAENKPPQLVNASKDQQARYIAEETRDKAAAGLRGAQSYGDAIISENQGIIDKAKAWFGFGEDEKKKESNKMGGKLSAAESGSRFAPVELSRAEMSPNRGFNIPETENGSTTMKFDPIDINLNIIGGSDGEAPRVIAHLAERIHRTMP